MLLTNQQINDRYDHLAHDKAYIQQLIADMFDGEGHNREITPEDVSRLNDIIFNTDYLRDIAIDQLMNELCYS
jgi:hypothetical protein